MADGFSCVRVEGIACVWLSLWPGAELAGLPAEGRWGAAWGGVAVWVGPGQFLVQREGDGGLFAEVAAAVGDRGAVIDVTDARAVWRVGGTQSQRILAGLLPIDLHPRAFGPGQTATTLGAHMTILIRQIDTVPTYELAVSRSFAGSFARALALASGGRYQEPSAGVA